MSVAVACNLSDGVVVGVDSAVTIGDPQNPVKVYEDAEKLFPLGARPIGIATYGLAGFANRSIASYVNEFEQTQLENLANAGLPDVVEALRAFFMGKYNEVIIPALATELGVEIGGIPDERKPVLGLVVGGFSPASYQSEVWNVVLPFHAANNSSVLIHPQGSNSCSWFAASMPIRRYLKGVDPELFGAMISAFNQLRQPALTDAEIEGLQAIAQQYEFSIVFSAMPITKGIDFVRFMVNLVIGHHRFASGAPIVGGRSKIGVVTFRGGRFNILEGEGAL